MGTFSHKFPLVQTLTLLAGLLCCQLLFCYNYELSAIKNNMSFEIG